METIFKEGVVMNKSEVFVKVKDKKQAKQYKAILKALGEEIGKGYWIDDYGNAQDKLIFRLNGWVVVGSALNITEVSIKELIKILVNEETELPKTEDGFDLYEDQEFWSVFKKDVWHLGAKVRFPIANAFIRYPNEFKAFHLKENALKFIKEQKVVNKISSKPVLCDSGCDCPI